MWFTFLAQPQSSQWQFPWLNSFLTITAGQLNSCLAKLENWGRRQKVYTGKKGTLTAVDLG